MKRAAFVIMALLFFGVALRAERVTKQEAARLAGEFFGGNEPRSVWDGQDCYAFDNPAGGWVIISADNVTVPVLGYSPTGKFRAEGMPSNIRIWFKHISENVNIARVAKIAPSDEIRKKWASVGVKTRAGSSGKLLPTAEWDQCSPYNAKCPTVTGERSTAYAGCVACAMAIVMRYHKWPERGNGTLDSYSFTTSTGKTQKISGYSIDGKQYNWNQMPENGNTSTWTSAQKNAVAELMHDCGVMVKMEYSQDGSAAYSSEVTPAMVEHMYYSASAREEYRLMFSDSQWLKMIQDEIDAERPVIYGGSDDEMGGHQFVCDGYDADGNIHINWGWGGWCNGYYPVCYIGDKDRNKINAVFNQYDSAIFGVEKDENGSSAGTPALYLQSSGEYCGLKYVSGTIAKGSSFKVKIGYICSESESYAYDGAVKLGLTDINGEIKEYVGGEAALKLDKATSESLSAACISSYNCTITKDIEPGDCIAVFYRTAEGDWRRMGGFADQDEGDYVQTCIGVTGFPILAVKESYTTGNIFYFNNLIPGTKTVSKVKWWFDGTSNSTGYVKLTHGDHTVKVTATMTDGSTATLSQKIRVD